MRIRSASDPSELAEREQAQESLRRSEESYRNLFEHHPAPMWLFDPDTLRFLAANDAAVATYGYSREEFLSMTIADIRPEEDGPHLREVVAGLTSGLTQAGTWRHRRKDGSLIDVAIAAGASEFEGRPACLVLVQDVTERRRLEDQLRQAQKMDAIGSLAGGIAHDFNNVLMVIRAHAAAMLKRTEDAAALEDLGTIDIAAQRAADLTRQLLAFSRQQVLHAEVTDLDAVVTDTLALLHRVIGEDIELVTELEDDLHPVVVDRSQLGQVILNLAVNARDAMPGGGTIHIRTTNVDVDEAFARDHVDISPGPHVLLQVTDSGQGMSEATRERAFDPFFTTKDTGTGLGLATVYGIVKQSGGDIWLYSEPELGTTFKIYLPSAETAAEPLPEPAPVPSCRGSETILLVEDEDLLRPLLADSLRTYGYTVIAAAGGPQALELAEGHELDALITDVVMPVMNGRELAERLVAERPGLRVLFTSGYPSDTIVRQGIASATAAYIEKPYLPEDLAAKVRQVLDDSES